MPIPTEEERLCPVLESQMTRLRLFRVCEQAENPKQQKSRLSSLLNDILHICSEASWFFFEERGEDVLAQETSIAVSALHVGMQTHTFLGQAFGLFELLVDATEIEDMERIRAEVAVVQAELLRRKVLYQAQQSF